jgi:hypothetical protein
VYRVAAQRYRNPIRSGGICEYADKGAKVSLTLSNSNSPMASPSRCPRWARSPVRRMSTFATPAVSSRSISLSRNRRNSTAQAQRCRPRSSFRPGRHGARSAPRRTAWVRRIYPALGTGDFSRACARSRRTEVRLPQVPTEVGVPWDTARGLRSLANWLNGPKRRSRPRCTRQSS